MFCILLANASYRPEVDFKKKKKSQAPLVNVVSKDQLGVEGNSPTN